MCREDFHLLAEIVIKEKLQELTKFEGETAKLQCKIKNPKNYPIKWFRNGEEITFPNDKYVGVASSTTLMD